MDLLERDQYLDQLAHLLNLAMTGQGRTVLISGEQGAGKTALVEQFVHQHTSAIRSLWGACEELFTPRFLGPLYDIAAQTRGRLSALIKQDTERPILFSTLLEELRQSPLPTVLVFEDVHWADEATLDLLKFLGRRIFHLPALFLVTYRDHGLGLNPLLQSVMGDLPASAVARISLPLLSKQAVVRLAHQAHREADQVYRVTSGNPFLVTEVLASDTPEIPMVVRDAVFARIVRLSSGARTLLELVSVALVRTDRWLLDAILGKDIEALEECLACGMLSLEQRSVAFRHELIRRAVESTLSPLRRQRLRQQVVQAMLAHGEDTSRIARLIHPVRGVDAGFQEPELASLAGVRREEPTHDATEPPEVSRFSLQRRIELLEGRAYECYLTSQLTDAIQARQQVLRLWQELERPDQVGQTLLWISRLTWLLGQSAEARRFAIEAVRLLEPLPPESSLAMAYSHRAHLAMLAESTKEAIQWSERAIELAESLGDEQSLAHALNTLGTTLLTAQQEQGRLHLERSLQLALARGWEEHVARAYTHLVGCAVMAREYSQAECFLQVGLAYCVQHNLTSWSPCLEAWQARVHLEQGRWEEAVAAATQVLERYRFCAAAVRIPALAVLGCVRVRRGDSGSREVLEEARELALATGEAQRLVPVVVARAEAAWLEGNLSRCLQEGQVGSDLPLMRSDPWKLGEVSIWQWRGGGLSSAPGPIAEPYARQIAGDWRAAAQLWEQLGCPYEQALALTSGDASAQQEALALFEQLGARPAMTLVRQRVRLQSSAGTSRGPYRATRSNQAGLTSRQLEVLQLMVEGFSNAEIASQLFTSIKTVDHHVSAVLAKLGVRSRAQAIRLAYQTDLFFDNSLFARARDQAAQELASAEGIEQDDGSCEQENGD